MTERQPRQRSETITGSILLAVAALFAALTYVVAIDPPKDLPAWLIPTWFGIKAGLFALWGTAILHGGFTGRRYE